MTGTGTQNDPYIVDNWTDFVTAIETSGAYVEFSENTEINMNEIAPEGIDPITVKCKNIDGKGATISKLVFDISGKSAFTFDNTINISSLNFKDSEIKSGKMFNTNGSGINPYFYMCRFSGAFIGGFAGFYAGNENNFRRCAFTMDLYQYASFVTSSTGSIGVKDSEIKLNGQASNDIPIYLNATNLYGNIEMNPSYGASYRKITISNSSQLSVIELGMKNVGRVNYTGSGAILINTDLSGNTTLGTGLLQVNTEQLHDAEYLKEIGFTIGV